jgi:hypothetical protein
LKGEKKCSVPTGRVFASNYLIFDAFPRFFDDERHLQYKFQWFAKKSIIKNIEVQVGPQFGFLLDVLKCWIPTKYFAQKIEAANLKVGGAERISPSACLSAKRVKLFWAKTRSRLLRFENEEVVEGVRALCTLKTRTPTQVTSVLRPSTGPSSLSNLQRCDCVFLPPHICGQHEVPGEWRRPGIVAPEKGCRH